MGCTRVDAFKGVMDLIEKATGVPMPTTMPRTTRLDAYHEALRFLEQAVDALDQAHASLKDCRCDNITSDSYHRLSPRQIVILAGGMLEEARNVECEDCGRPLLDCECPWLRERIGRRG